MQLEADALDLVVGPVVREGCRVRLFLSATHESAGAAIIESDGVERFSLYLEDFHWPEFAYEEQVQRQVIHDLARLATLHLFGHTKRTTTRRLWRTELVGLEVPWEGQTYLVNKQGRTPIT